jgi:hypothetical protein
MRLLFESEDAEDLENYRLLFEGKGIPVYISSTGAFKASSRIVGYKKGFWVYLDSQFPDAQILLIDKNHIVVNPVDIESFNLHKKNFDKSFSEMTSHKFERFFNYFTVCFALCICLWIAWVIFKA